MNDDWLDDRFDWDAISDDDGVYFGWLERESPALQFRREASQYFPNLRHKNYKLAEMAEDDIWSCAKHYLEICYDLVESRQMYRALNDIGMLRYAIRYSGGRSYEWLKEQCNDYTTRKHCDTCGQPVYFLPENEPKLMRCHHCIERGHHNNPSLHVLKTMPYVDYLKTDHWKRTRIAAVERATGRCQLCNAGQSLHVHHRTYERRGEELPEDLTVLCADCHRMFHQNGRLQS
jgi:hypothetical protein